MFIGSLFVLCWPVYTLMCFLPFLRVYKPEIYVLSSPPGSCRSARRSVLLRVPTSIVAVRSRLLVSCLLAAFLRANKRGGPRAGGRKCALRRSWTELGLNGNARRPLLLAEVARTSVFVAWAMRPVLQYGREPKGKVIESQLACTPALAYPLFFTVHLVSRRGGSFVRQSTFASPSCSQA